MPYEDILERAEQHMTTRYDTEFKAAKTQNLKWFPWVGKNYDKSKVFILGMSTYYVAGADWSDEWVEYGETNPNPSRVLIEQHAIEAEKRTGCFSSIAIALLQGADKEYNATTRSQFWESVAFGNFVQKVIEYETPIYAVDSTVIESSKEALQAVIDILEPDLVLAWTTELWYVSDGKWREGKRFGNPIPRVIEGCHPIVGVLHPSWWQQHRTKRTDWFKFLCNDPASKDPVKNLVNHLKEI